VPSITIMWTYFSQPANTRMIYEFCMQTRQVTWLVVQYQQRLIHTEIHGRLLYSFWIS